MEEKSSIFGLTLNEESAMIIKTSASWARILSVSGFILSGIMMMLGIVTKVVFSSFEKHDYSYNDRSVQDTLSMGGSFAMAIYIIIAVILLISSVFLYRFAKRVSTALRTNNIVTLNAAFSNMRAHLSIWAVVMIMVLLFIVLGILSVIL